jgi:hybrid cluster-associated redox disulfide protein
MITKDMNIRKIIEIDEDLAGILIASGMHCLGCAMSHFENLEEACAVHGIDADALCSELNAYLENKQ